MMLNLNEVFERGLDRGVLEVELSNADDHAASLDIYQNLLVEKGYRSEFFGNVSSGIYHIHFEKSGEASQNA